MYNYDMNNMNYMNKMPNNYGNQSNDNRFIGGFAFPFLLGGVTGAAIAPNFWNQGYGPRPPYGPGNGPVYGPVPPYGRPPYWSYYK